MRDLPRAFAPATRALVFKLRRVERRANRRRECTHAVLALLPMAQASILLPLGDRWDFHRLSGAAIVQWETARFAHRGSGAVKIVDGVPETAYAFVFPREDVGRGRDPDRFHRNSLWGEHGPFRELAHLGIYQRRQPPAGATEWVGHRRCGDTRCKRRRLEPDERVCRIHPDAPVRQFSICQTRYGRAMCGSTALALARRGDRRALELVARYAPELIAGAAVPEVVAGDVMGPTVELGAPAAVDGVGPTAELGGGVDPPG